MNISDLFPDAPTCGAGWSKSKKQMEKEIEFVL